MDSKIKHFNPILFVRNIVLVPKRTNPFSSFYSTMIGVFVGLILYIDEPIKKG